MKLWLIKPVYEYQVGYDCAQGFVVRARHPKQARELASIDCGDEGPSFWLNATLSTCKQLKVEGQIGMILRDYLAR